MPNYILFPVPYSYISYMRIGGLVFGSVPPNTELFVIKICYTMFPEINRNSFLVMIQWLLLLFLLILFAGFNLCPLFFG